MRNEFRPNLIRIRILNSASRIPHSATLCIQTENEHRRLRTIWWHRDAKIEAKNTMPKIRINFRADLSWQSTWKRVSWIILRSANMLRWKLFPLFQSNRSLNMFRNSKPFVFSSLFIFTVLMVSSANSQVVQYSSAAPTVYYSTPTYSTPIYTTPTYTTPTYSTTYSTPTYTTAPTQTYYSTPTYSTGTQAYYCLLYTSDAADE